MLFACLLAGCASVGPSNAFWWQELAADLDSEVVGCVVGDLDQRYPGEELCVVTQDGRIRCLRRSLGEWLSEEVARLPGEPSACAVYDLLPEYAGPELFVTANLPPVGDLPDRGRGWMLWRTEGGWQRAKVLAAAERLNAVAGVERGPDAPTPTVVLAGQACVAHVLSYEGDSLLSGSVGPIPGVVNAASLGLGGVTLACEDGSLCALRRSSGSWALEVIEHFQSALTSLSASHDEVLVCAKDGLLRHVTGAGVRGIEASSLLLSGVVLREAMAGAAVELCTADAVGEVSIVTVLEFPRDESEPVHRDDSPQATVWMERVARCGSSARGVTGGDLPGLGQCLVVWCKGGVVLVLGTLHGR